MTTPVFNNDAFLRTTREFPEDIRQLTVQMSKGWIELANAINNRTISLFPTTRAALNGESWYLANNQRSQGLRQVYTFTTVANPINHGLKNVKPGQFIRCFGSYTDGTNTYGLIFGSSTLIAGQILFYVSSTQIVFVPDAGAPTVTSGTVVLEWVSNP